MLFGTFAWSFVYVSLPFHIRAMSPLDATAALTWTGWIFGSPNLATVVVAPVWGRLAWTSPLLLYLVLAAIGVACVPVVRMGRAVAGA